MTMSLVVQPEFKTPPEDKANTRRTSGAWQLHVPLLTANAIQPARTPARSHARSATDRDPLSSRTRAEFISSALVGLGGGRSSLI
jgi:hypothetical protein